MQSGGTKTTEAQAAAEAQAATVAKYQSNLDSAKATNASQLSATKAQNAKKQALQRQGAERLSQAQAEAQNILSNTKEMSDLSITGTPGRNVGAFTVNTDSVGKLPTFDNGRAVSVESKPFSNGIESPVVNPLDSVNTMINPMQGNSILDSINKQYDKKRQNQQVI